MALLILLRFQLGFRITLRFFDRLSASYFLDMTREVIVFGMLQYILVVLMTCIKLLLQFLLGLDSLMKAIKKTLLHISQFLDLLIALFESSDVKILLTIFFTHCIKHIVNFATLIRSDRLLLKLIIVNMVSSVDILSNDIYLISDFINRVSFRIFFAVSTSASSIAFSSS